MLASVALPALAIAPRLGLLVGRLTAPAGRRAAGEPSRQPSRESGVHLASVPEVRILIFGNWRRWSARPR